MNPDIAWRIIVKTANSTASGINSTVFLKIHGEKGSVRPIELGDKSKKAAASRSPFSRNCTSQFLAKREDVGSIKAIEIWHNAETDWHCEYIEIQRGNEAWKFRPQGRVATQREMDTPVPTRLVGEHSTVSNGATPFHNAAKDGDMEALQRMVTGEEYDVDVEDKLGRTAAMYAALHGQKDALDFLMEKRCSITKRDKAGKTCLHHACMNHDNNVDIINRSLLRAAARGGIYGDDMDSRGDEEPLGRYILEKDMFGKTAMHYAATYGFVPVIQLLDNKCRVALRDQDQTQQTPLHCAAIQGEAQAALTLIDLGAQTDVKDKHEKTFLHHAATAGHTKFITTVLNYNFDDATREELMELLEVPDVSGRTPLLCAAADGGLETLKALYELKASMFAVDKDKSNALHHAAKKGDDAILSYLSQKLDINLKNAYEYNALHVAVEHNNVRAVRWLLKHEADIHAKSIADLTPLDLAKMVGDEDVIRILSNAVRLAAEEAPSGEQAKDDAVAGGATNEQAQHIHAPDHDDQLAFDTGMEEEYAKHGGRANLLDEIAALKAEIAALKEKVKTKNRIIELLKGKLGLGGVDIEEEIKAGRMCQEQECVVM